VSGKDLSGKDRIRKIGMARALSKLGYCSRSRASGLIRSGRVRLNETIRRDPETPVSENHDRIFVDGKLVEAPEKMYCMMNKPRGVVTTASDEKGRATVYSLLAASSADAPIVPAAAGNSWVAPVGRLDKASEGLLLLTNDSEWAARIAAPESHLDKTYHVQVSAIADDDFLHELECGVKMKDGSRLSAKRARRLRCGEKNCWLEIVLDEGKNRQIRRMMEAMGVEVLRLIRVSIGPLQLGDLAKGAHRALTLEEKQMLDRAMRQAS
jgi:23S rRNA pseudouridine2605 synthase